MMILSFLAGLMLLASPDAPLSGSAEVEANRPDNNAREEIFFDHYSPAYDSLRHVWQEQNSLQTYESFFRDFVDIEGSELPASEIPDSVYAARLRSIVSAVPLPYNDIVKDYIISYTTKNKSLIGRVLGRSQFYFPMIEQELDRAGLPLELKMLAVVESALTSSARSHMAAVGLWQFMLPTGKRYGLEVTSFVDMRRDPVAATKAAVAHMDDLYEIYGDWLLVLAAYNCGPGNVEKAFKKAGANAKSYWDIYPYLPKETRGYVPSFIGATYAYHYHRQHDIVPDPCPMPLAVDTVHVSRLMHFDQITSTTGTPKDLIQSLNPQYIRDIVPALEGKTYPLVLPLADISEFVANEAEIMAKDTVYLAQYLKPSNVDPKRKEFSLTSFTHTVKSGENLATIAKKYGVTTKQIIEWNKLKNPNKLKVKQKLELYR